MWSASDARQKTPSGIVRPSDDVSSLRSTTYGPATSAVMYDEMRGVGSNAQRATSTSPAPVPVGSAFVPSASGAGVGWLLTTSHAAGAVTVNANVALRSGCSKTANTRRESGTSNCV